ncbi:MAG: L,D-transpeptidase family protein [Candidatus Omnitrophota bacterium]|jgi:lipoprotein-anchoring transpeptidase ErfK/SrfK
MRKYWLLAVAGALAAVLILAAVVKTHKGGSGTRRISEKPSVMLPQARELEKKGDLSGASAVYQELIAEYANSPEVVSWQKKADELNIQLLFSPAITANSAAYVIKPGDNLIKIAKQFKTTPELIMKSNNMTGDRIMPGRKIKVCTSPFSVFVDKSQNILILKTGEEIVKTYVVSTGADNSSPVGTFKIVNKIVNPTWFKSGAVVPPGSPENVLGTRWMGFDISGYGIHGTTEPEKLGRQVTQGCVRMANSDAEELYTIIPVGTEVVIVD